MNKLQSDVLEIRRKLVEEKTGDSDPSDNYIRDILIGNCVENAEYLAKHLSERGYNTKIIEGAVDLPKEPIPQNYEDAVKTGTVHHWVETNHNGQKFFLNMIKEGPITSEPLVSTELPSAYIRF